MKRFVRPRAIALVAAGALSIAAVSASMSAMAQVDAAKSSVTATGKQLGVPMDIKFGKFDAAVNYNAANVAASTATVNIDINSVDVGSKDYNDELKKKDWSQILLTGADFGKFVAEDTVRIAAILTELGLKK